MGFAAEAEVDAVGTYNRHVVRFDHYGDILDYGCVALAAKLGKDFFK